MSVADTRPIGTADLFFGEIFYSESNIKEPDLESTRWRGEIWKASEYMNGPFNIYTKILPSL